MMTSASSVRVDLTARVDLCDGPPMKVLWVETYAIKDGRTIGGYALSGAEVLSRKLIEAKTVRGYRMNMHLDVLSVVFEYFCRPDEFHLWADWCQREGLRMEDVPAVEFGIYHRLVPVT